MWTELWAIWHPGMRAVIVKACELVDTVRIGAYTHTISSLGMATVALNHASGVATAYRILETMIFQAREL